MGKKEERALIALLQQQNAQAQARFDQALAQAQQVDPYTKLISDQAIDIANWAKGGDFRSAPKGVFWDLVDPAINKRQRELAMNTKAQGVAAFGSPNTTLLNLNKQNLDDEFSRDSAMNYQNQVSNTVNSARGIIGGLGNQETEKRFNLLNTLGGMSQNTNSNLINYQAKLASKPSGWSKFLGGLASGAIGAL